MKESDDFLQIINENAGIIFKISNFYCRNSEDRKDLIQEIIFQIWKSFPTYNGSVKISTWIYRIALNIAISNYRKSSKLATYTSSFTEILLDTHSENQNESAKENIELLYAFIFRLKELDKALMLLYLEEKTYQEMADILGISSSNVATKIGRIKQKLKQYFESLEL